MTNIKDKPGGRPAKKRIEKQQRVVSTKLTELQYYAIRKRAGEAGLRVSEYVMQAVVSLPDVPPACPLYSSWFFTFEWCLKNCDQREKFSLR